MSCTCTSCESDETTPECPQCICEASAILVIDDSCAERSIEAKPSSLLSSEDEMWKAANGSESEPINLSLVKEECSGAAVFIRDSAGNLSVIPYSESNEGLFLGFLDGEVKALEIDRELLSYDEEAVGSHVKGKLAIWGCGANGKLTLGKLDLANCSVGVDENGDAECGSQGLCLPDNDSNITESLYVIALNSDKCARKIPIPQDAKCYELGISKDGTKNALVVREQTPKILFIDTFPIVLNDTITTASKEGEIDLTSRLPADECFYGAQLLVEVIIKGASRLTGTAEVTIGGVVLMNLSAYWYAFDTGRVAMLFPLGTTNKIAWKVTKAGSHFQDPTIKVRLVSLSK